MNTKSKLFTILGIVVVISMLIVTAPMAPVSAAPPLPGTIIVSPASGVVGSAVAVNGSGFSGFSPGTLLTINFLGRSLPNPVRLSPDGTFYCELYIGRVAGGTYDTFVTTNTGDLTSNKVPYTVTPNITLDHSSGNNGNSIMVNGTGFAANTDVTVKFGVNDWFTVNTGPNGLFDYYWVNVPSVADGTYLVSVGEAAPVTFSVPRNKWPVTITEDYTLTSDMEFNDSGFIIEADNVTLDLNGHTVTGSFAPNPPIGPTSFGISTSGHSGLTVKNGTVEGFTYGLYFENSDGNSIQNFTAQSNADAGLYFNVSDGNLITQATAKDGGNIGLGGFGLVLASSSNNSIKNLVSMSNKLVGVAIFEYIDDFSTNNVLQDSVISGNEEWGLSLHRVSNSTITDNVIDGNALGAFRPLPIPPSGLGLIDAHNNFIRGNTFDNNGNVGLSIDNSSNNEIKNNEIQSNAGPGVALNVSSGNQISNNQIHFNRGNGLIVGGPLPSNMSKGNLISSNKLTDNNGRFSILDLTSGTGTAGTANIYEGNIGESSNPFGIIISPLGIAFTKDGSVTIETDQSRYLLGEPVVIDGEGFRTGPLFITIVYPDGHNVSIPGVLVDSSGSFQARFYPPPFLPLLNYVPGLIPGRYWVTVSDGQGLARTKYEVVSSPPKDEAVGRIILVLQTIPGGASGFGFTMDYGATIGYPFGLVMKDDAAMDSGYVVSSGIHWIDALSLPAGWQLTGIDIADQSGGSYIDGTKTIIDLADGETVTVTYTYTQD